MNSTDASTNSTLEHLLWPSSIVDMLVSSINFLFGFPVHSYIIWLIVTGTGNGVASESFNINLSICELWISLNCLLSVLSNILPNVVQLTALSFFLAGVVITGRPLFQCLMCVERYLAVVHPVIFLKFKPLRYRVICCTVIWIITFGFLFVLHAYFLPKYIGLVYVVVPDSVPSLPLHSVVLSCGCSQSFEAVRTRREREREEKGRKPH